MRVERLSNNQFTVFLTFDDLIERGFNRNDLWHDTIGVENLFSDIMYDASDEIEFELDGLLLVQVYLMQAQGMYVIVTQNNDVIADDEDYIEMKVTLDESDELIFLFSDFEHIIQVSSYLYPLGIKEGQVYYYNDQYYILFEEGDLPESQRENIIAVLSEYSQSSIITSYRLREYGKLILGEKAIETIIDQFHE